MLWPAKTREVCNVLICNWWKLKVSRAEQSASVWGSREGKMSLIWLEAMLPLGIIAGMLCVMGNAQYYIHKAAHGRPKHIGNDMWDVAMERRDKKLMEQASPSN